MKLLLAAAALGLLLLSPRLALACGCLGTTTVCKSYAGAEAVFVGAVTRVSNKTAKDENGNEHIVGQVAKVQVEEAFKGAKEPELTFRSYGTSCDVTYKEGQRWLFYASYSKEDKAWAIGVCGRSTLAEHAPDDLSYLRGLPGSAQKTRLAGELRTRDNKTLMGVKVKLIGQTRTYEVFTDKNGVYEVYDLPAGKYVVAPETPLNLKLNLAIGEVAAGTVDRMRPLVEVKEKSCTGVNFYFTENTAIAGRVLGADGQPMSGVSVLEGSKGTLHGSLYAHSRDLPNCPQIDKLVKAYKDIETKRIKLELNRDHQDIELLFTIPFCAKKKEDPQ